MRPVDADAIANLAAEQFVSRDAEMLRLGVEQRVLDRADRLRHDATGGWPGPAVEIRIDPLMRARILADDAQRKALDRAGKAGGAKAFVELTPTDNAARRRHLDEMIVAPA